MDPVLVRLLVVVAVIALAVTAGLLLRRREGVVRDGGEARWTEQEMRAVGLGTSATDAPVRAVLLGSPTCAPCESVKRVLGEVAGRRGDLSWVSVDAADHLEVARRHHVMRVPTLFVLDEDGRIIARTSGVPASTDLERALDRESADAAG